MGMRYGRPFDNLGVRPVSITDGYGDDYGYGYGSTDPTLPILINGNGSYTSAPAKDEDAQYPMANVLSYARYTVWSTKVGTADTAIKVKLDFGGGATGGGAGGADRTISSAGLLGLRGHSGTAPPPTVVLGYRTRAQGYSATGYTTVTTLSPDGERDMVAQFDAVSGRYWEFNINPYNAAGFSLGAFWLGILQDFGHYWSADGGAAWAEDHNVLLTVTAGGHRDAVSRGDRWARYTLTFRAIPASQQQKLHDHFGARQRTKPILILDEAGVPRQFFVTSGPQFSQRFTGLYDAVLELERLG